MPKESERTLKALQNFGKNMLSDDFGRDVLEVIRANAYPEEVFSKEELEEWAEENGFVKKEATA